MPSDQPFRKRGFAEIVDGLLEDAASGRGGRTVLTDAAGGSVVRTLMEVYAREMAVCYEQLELVYRSAYLDTAGGAALNYVVALTGLQRRPPGHLEGQVTFSRSQPAPQDIHIPAGTQVAGRGQPAFATVDSAVLVQGERLVSVGVLSLEPVAEGDVQEVKAGLLTTMPRPIAGIEQVANTADLIPRQRAETDEELRQRARAQARSTNTGTVAAIEQAVRLLGIQEVRVLEYPMDPVLLPGQIHVVIGDPDPSPPLLEQVADRIEQVRPVGIQVGSGAATRVWVQVTATLTLDVEHTEPEKKAIESRLQSDLITYFGQLGVGETVHQAKIRSILLGQDTVIGCDASPGFDGLLEPFELIDGTPRSQASRYLLSNGDILVGKRARIGLLPAQLPIRLTLLGPAPAVLVDIAIELPAGANPAGIAERLVAGPGRLIADAAKAGKVEFKPLLDAINLVVAADQRTALRVTVVHEADGRVVELSGDVPEDALGERELPRLRNTPVTVKT